MDSNQYMFIVFSIFFLSVVSFSLFINAILLKFATTLGIRERELPVIRWSSVSKPALGGITFYIAYLLSLASFSLFFETKILEDATVLGGLSACSLAFLMGLADDAYDTKPLLKLGVQVFCGGLLIVTGNVIDITEISVINYLITIFWVVGIMNSINMLDNMDGITTVVSGGIIISSLIAMMIMGNFNQFDFMSGLGILAALIGFLFFNWNPSKMYMGDTGSQFLGMYLAYIGVKYIWNGTLNSGEMDVWMQLSLVLIVFALPITDTASVSINRIARGQSPFKGGKDHTTHHLSYIGLSDSQVAFVFMGVSILSIVMAIAAFKFIDAWLWYHTLIYLGVFLFIFVTLYALTQKNKNRRNR
jgi:UDP-GlcNAc:undecaprenyl-phosphate/decaprenyl-phosphate GlcNAc-1-phosphate transferase